MKFVFLASQRRSLKNAFSISPASRSRSPIDLGPEMTGRLGEDAWAVLDAAALGSEAP